LNLEKFSLNGPDNYDLIPILKKIVEINPNVKILATPWTAPTWMKTNTNDNNKYIGGKLNEKYYASYANYFIKYFEAMRAHGIEIWAITPQNEPLHDGNEPSMKMTKEEQFNFIHNHLGPSIENSEFKHIKVIAYDHNCDNTDYPVYVSKSKYVDGSAFHLYDEESNINALTEVYNTTGKNIYFTEQYTGPDNFSGDLGWHMEKVMIGATNNWAKIVLQWNLAADQNFEPRTPQGCSSCLGALTIEGSNISRNVSYYLVAHMSKVTEAGSIRIQSTSTDSGLLTTAFENPDGSISLVIYNKSNRQKTFDLLYGDKFVSYNISANSVASLTWPSNKIIYPVQSISLNLDKTEIEKGKTIQLSASILPENASNKEVVWSSDNPQTAKINNSGQVIGLSVGSAIITATTVNEGKTSTCHINVTPHSEMDKLDGIYNIISVYSDKGLDVKDKSVADGASIQQWEIVDGGNDNQRWAFVRNEDGNYYIKSKLSNLYLSPETNKDENGIGLIQQKADESKPHQWLVTSYENGLYYKIINLENARPIDISGPSLSNGAKIHLWNYLSSAESQQ